MEQIHTLDDSTLGELRKLVAATEGLSDDAPIWVRTRWAPSSAGLPITRVHIGEAKRS